MLEEDEQDIEGAAPELDELVAPFELALRREHSERPEGNNLVDMLLKHRRVMSALARITPVHYRPIGSPAHLSSAEFGGQARRARGATPLFPVPNSAETRLFQRARAPCKA